MLCLFRVHRSSHGTPLELEGLPQALPRFRLHLDLSRYFDEREGPVQHAQPCDRQSPQAPDARQRHRRPFGKGIMGTTLHYPYEIRGEESVFEDIPDMDLPDQMVGLAEEIIDRMSGEFEPDKFEDRYENAMIELIRSKQAKLPAPLEKAPMRPANVVNLMDALKRSIEAGEPKAKPANAGKRAMAEAAPAKKRVKKAG